jgi:hypothetical protein
MSAPSAVPTITPKRAHLEQFFSRVDPVRGRLIFALDATASREPTWDTAAHLTTQMFATVTAIGGLDVQLVYYRGHDECTATRWQSDARALTASMQRVNCVAGFTQIRRVLNHVRKENARQKVNALVLISDACEERAAELYSAARELGNVPVFMFQEGNDERVGEIYAEIARLTGGAHCRFDSSSAQRLADLLKAVAAFAAGGMQALAAQKTEAARLLLTQVKKS